MNLIPPGTPVPGYRLFRPRSTSSGQALRDYLVAASTVFYDFRKSKHSIMLVVSG
jgi:hypothetical protein